MPIHLKVETELDQSSARRAADEVQNHFRDASRNIGTEFSTSLRGGIDEAVRGISSQLGPLGSAAESAFGKFSSGGLVAAAGIAGIGVAAVAAGKQLYDLGAQWDEITDNLAIRTGKVGDDLKNLTSIVGDIGKTTAADLSAIGDVVGQLAQSLPNLGGDALKQMGSNLAFLDAHGQAVNIRELSMAFNAFGVDAQNQVGALDNLNRSSQATGIPINDLLSTIKTGAPVFRQFGLDLGQATAVLADFQQAGLDPATVVTSMRIAFKNLGDDARGAGPALADTVTQIKALYDANQAGAAQMLAISTFGAKNFAPILTAIEQGTIDGDSFKKAMYEIGPSLQNLQKNTDDGTQALKEMGNQLKTDLKPAADTVFGGMNDALKFLTRGWREATDAAATYGRELSGGSFSGVGGAAGGGLGVSAGTGVVAPQGIGGAFGGGLLPYSWGSNLINPPGGASGSGPKLPSAPVLPFGTALPPGFADLPQTASMFSAETAYLDAQHTLAEKQARLTQLQQTNAATADDIQKARNDVAEAERRQQEVELRLYDTRQELFDKSNKQLNNYLNDMNGISAGLDKDLGISKGLGGIADNLVRFLATLAAAPLLGQLSASATAQEQNAPGSSLGLIPQILGRAGLFGSGQNTGTGSGSGATAVVGPDGNVIMMPSSGAGGGGFSDAALLGNVPAGRYDASGDLSKGLGDCSSAVEDLVNIMDGRPTAGRGMSTGNEAEWLTSHGFLPGLGGPGDFRVGFNSEHTQATLPGGTPFNWGSNAAAAAGGVGGTGAFDPSFTSHYYRPVGGGGDLYGAANTNPALNNPAAGAGGAPGSPNWDATAQGESSGNWKANTGNGFFGGLQFTQSSWMAAGGGKYAQRADLATPEQQKSVADRLLAMQGPGAWPHTFQSFQSGGAIPMADPKYIWGPPTPGEQQGKESWADNPGGIIPPKMGPSTGGWSPGSLPDIAHKIQAMPKMQGGGGVPIMAHAGEHMLTTDDVAAMGGQSGVYKFRSMLHMQGGGPIPPIPLAPPPPPPPPPPVPNNAGPAPSWFGGNLPGIWGMIGEAAGNQPGGIGQAAGIGGAGPQSVQPGQQPSSRSPGGGSASGGAPVALAEAAASIFPGGGAAASVLMQLITRGIKYAGQAASIGVMGLMETFLPGGTELSDPSKSLVGRVASGIAGGQPASPNQAAKAKPPQAPPPPAGSPASGRGAGPLPGPPGSERPQIVIQNQTIQTPDTGAYEREMSRIAASHAAGDNTR